MTRSFCLPFFICFALLICSTSPAHAHDYDRAAIDSVATVIPDRIILTWNGDPATSAAVTWRTNTEIVTSEGEIALADPSPNFRFHATKVPASMERFEDNGYAFHSHSVTFEGLKPGTRYAYRVGSGEIWSEWFQFKTAKSEPAPSSLFTSVTHRTTC